ncbi:amidase [Mycolicibacterium sp. YH-1]|uniref:amidase n=1 Tax=Mycolicibacterium sp. YH-1 TaxID=2908837 RepID=UPI001F4C2FE3|nr:amidase family protein [Mycolicibacterium sp. YH-1]UNB52551.1 amidase family protein [Mycolicibacterium sp. YH-1]
MKFAEYAEHDATALADAIRSGQVSAEEVRQTAFEAVGRMNEQLNAVVEGPWPVPPVAPASNGVFAGVPFVFKDVVCHAKGVPMRMGTLALKEGVVFETNTALMERFLDAGLVLVANTTTPELALSCVTASRLTGTTLNPWNTEVTVGASSGGSAALVASGAVPMAHANDGGGSIRIPAARTGLVGLKPSRARVSAGPDYAEIMSGNAIEFAITRTVRDAATLLDAVHGYQAGDRYATVPPNRPYRDEIRQRPSSLRIAVTSEAMSSVAVDAEVSDAVDGTARLLTDLGHEVSAVQHPIDWYELTEIFNVIWGFGVAATVKQVAEIGGVDISLDYFDESTLVSHEFGMSLGALDLADAYAGMNSITRRYAAFMSDYDVIVQPTANRVHVPPTHLESKSSPATSLEWVRTVLEEYPMCCLYNVTGAPAVSLPLMTSKDGLPIGIQFGGRMFDEGTLLSLAAQLEEAQPWAQRRPSIHVSALD